MSRVTVEQEIDKALESALAELRGALVLMGNEAANGEMSFLGVERRFSAAMLSFARQLLAVMLSFYDMDVKYLRFQNNVWRRKKAAEPREYFSAWGPLKIERHVYQLHGQSAGKQLVTLERRAGLIDGAWTPQAAEAMARLVQSAPSREAAENLKPLGLLPYSRSSFERVALAVGERWETECETLEDALIEAVEMPEEAAGISVAFDRVRIDTDETVLDPARWPNGRKQPREINGRMAYCAAVTLHDAAGEALWTKRYGRNALKEQGSPDPGLGEWSIREQVLWDVEALIKKRPDLGERAVVLSDGGPELERIVREDYKGWLNICDLYHFSEKLDDALKDAGFGDALRHKKRKSWLEMLKKKTGAITQIERELSFLHGEKVAAALTYIKNRHERFDYASASQKNLPVGSGHVEATCKSLVQVRMRRCGQRWTPPSAQALLNLRCLALSDLWQEGIELLLDGYVEDDFKPCPKPARRSAA